MLQVEKKKVTVAKFIKLQEKKNI